MIIGYFFNIIQIVFNIKRNIPTGFSTMFVSAIEFAEFINVSNFMF